MDNVKKRTLCAANPRSRKATISSFFKSLALRFSFSVCCRTCLRVLFREGLVVLRVASVTLYDAGDADIFSLSLWRGNVRNERERGERILASGAFSVSRKSKNSSGRCFCASFAFFTRFVFSLFALLHKGLRSATPNFGQLFSGQFCHFAPIKVGRNRLILANFLKPLISKSWPKSVNFFF